MTRPPEDTDGTGDREDAGTTLLLGLRLLAELGMLLALAWGGWHAAAGTVTAALLAVLLPVAAALVWGRWVAPRSGHRLRDPARAGVELALFTGAFVLVTRADADSVPWALLLLLVYLLSLPARRHRP